MNIDVLDGVVKDFPSMGVCFYFKKESINLHVHIIGYGNEDYHNGDCEILYSVYVIYPVKGFSSSIRIDSDVPLLGVDDIEIGVICIPDKESSSVFSSFTNPMIICLILEYSLLLDGSGDNDLFLDKIDFSPSNEYLLSFGCVLIERQFSNDYECKYKNSSAIWGGFTHTDLREAYKVSVQKISVIDGINIPTSEHELKLSESIFSSNSFDRFLKKYHLLELLYDYLCIAKLRTIDNGLMDYRNIMGDYSKEDIVNIKKIFSLYIDDVEGLCKVILDSTSYKPIMTSIFQIHSKDSNPLKNDGNWSKFWAAVEAGKLNSTDFKNKDYKFSGHDFKVTVLEILAYWVYRIRCSIAHNKIGEFLFSPSDEAFIVEFAEKIIDIVSAQIFSNLELKALLDKSKKIELFLNQS
ncbi:hypothetical protein P4S55_16445 [Shewanella sp. PP-Sp27a-2]